MAKSMTVGKRENEKKRLAKREEKLKRKENRKTNKSSIDDMIAYVDEYGMISSTPPEENVKKKEINLEEIMIATPKKEDEEPVILRGRVEFFNESRGFGFIKDLSGVEKYFFHVNNVVTEIKEGNVVRQIDIQVYCNETEEVLIEIKNNGPVIPPEIVEHIFIPFFTTKEGGSGIGLSISRQIMRLSGGSLTLLPDNKETKFILKFK